jgi:hypothetical protein
MPKAHQEGQRLHRRAQIWTKESKPAQVEVPLQAHIRQVSAWLPFGIALIGTGQAAFAQGVHTGSAESEQSDGGAAYTPGRY